MRAAKESAKTLWTSAQVLPIILPPFAADATEEKQESWALADMASLMLKKSSFPTRNEHDIILLLKRL
jgi:hypothetical protein